MSTEIGRRAEQAAAMFLQRQGHRVIQQNWRTRWCEIDIITKKDQTIYFVEVKYRANTAFGSGLEYITPKKLAQMHFAAEFWIASHKTYHEYRLGACEVSSTDFEVTTWLDDL